MLSVPPARVLGRFSDSRAPWPREEATFSTGRRFPVLGRGPVHPDGFRSRSPLRGSPGLAPGSLESPPTGGEPKTGRGIWRRGIFVNCEYRGRDSNPQPLRSERSTSTRLGYRGMCFHCWDCECRKRESNPQPPDSRSGASTELGYSGDGTAGLRRAAGGIRTRVHLSGAQGPRASRPRPRLRALLQGIEPCSHGRRPCCDPIASKSLCCEYPVRVSNPSFRMESAVSLPIDERGRRSGPGKARGRVPFWEPGL